MPISRYWRRAYTQDRLIHKTGLYDMYPSETRLVCTQHSPPPAPLISHNHHIQVQKALSGTVSCTNRAYARDTLRGLRVLCTSPAYARDRLVRDRRLQNSGFYTRQACAQVRLMHATLRYVGYAATVLSQQGLNKAAIFHCPHNSPCSNHVRLDYEHVFIL